MYYLYLKTHNTTGLNYLGYTSQDPLVYRGSGKYWLRHLAKHGYDVSTKILFKSSDKNAIKARGIELSKLLNIVESVDYANLIEERADGGWIHDQTGNTWKVKDSTKMGITFKSGRNHSEKWKDAVTGGNNYQCHHYIFTPWGKFDTITEAVNAAKQHKLGGRNDVVTDRTTLTKYCKSNIMLASDGRRTHPAWRGQWTTELGFYMESKNVD